MAQLDKVSVREELERCERQFKALVSEKKINSDTEALVQSLLTLVSVLVAIFLEKTTKKTSKNSSKPSSQTDKDESSLEDKGSHKKGRDENNELFANSRTIKTEEASAVSECDNCNADLTGTEPKRHERRTIIDIVFEKVVHTVVAEVKDCPECGTECKGKFPHNMPGPLQYGRGIIAYVLNLLIAQMVSLNRIQKTVNAMLGIMLSPATILNYVITLYNSLAEWEQVCIEMLLLSKVLNADETSMRVNKKNQWVHVLSSGVVTLKFLHPKRGKETIEDIGVLPRYGGVAVHDCWSSYFSYENIRHALCGSHLLRELTFIIDSNGYRWAKNLKKLLKATNNIVSKREDKKLTEQEYLTLQRRYRNILTRGQKELPPIPAKPNGKRGKIAKSDAHNLCERLQKYESAVLLFAKDSFVPFTNNRAERDLRMAKVKQKVSGCFRNQLHAKAYLRISSYLQTMANLGFNPLVAIQIALEGEAASMMK